VKDYDVIVVDSGIGGRLLAKAGNLCGFWKVMTVPE
jgi:hypothetical protein